MEEIIKAAEEKIEYNKSNIEYWTEQVALMKNENIKLEQQIKKLTE